MKTRQAERAQPALAVVAALVSILPQINAGTINGSFSPVASGSNVDLTVSGKVDWVHWGLYTESSIDRKFGGTGMISDYSILGTGVVNAYQYSDNYSGYTWYDGSPDIAVTNTTTGVWAYQAYPPELLGSGFQFTAPADTNWKTLQVFVGAFAARGPPATSIPSPGTSPSGSRT